MKFLHKVVFVLVLAFFGALFSYHDGYAARVDEPCQSIESIFGPGSGQGFGKRSDELTRFSESFRQYLEHTGISHNDTYRLGSEYQYGSEYGGGIQGYRYPAVPVNPIWSWEGATNSTVAYLTGNSGGFVYLSSSI